MIRNGITFKLDINNMNLNNYKLLLEGRDGIYLYWYRNSLVITFLGTVLSLFFTSLVGYGLAIYDFKGRNFLFILILIVMVIPIEILILPLYKLSISLKLIDTYWARYCCLLYRRLQVFLSSGSTRLSFPRELL